jgi:putative holliday junction resolvase
MSRIMGIDYGKKRTGISVTDPLKIIVTGLDTIETKNIHDFLQSYFQKESVEKVVIGLPTHKDGSYTQIKGDIDNLSGFIKNQSSAIEVDYIDEAYTSWESKQILVQSGIKKNKRQDKTLLDKTSAILILQRYLGHI